MSVSLENIRPIPWAIGYSVTRSGLILKTNGLEIIRHTTNRGYYSVQIAVEKIKSSGRRVNVNGILTDRDKRLGFKTFFAHRIVAEIWVPNPDPDKFRVVNHKDGNTLNNSADNLEWVDQMSNVTHAFNNMLINTSVNCKVRSFSSGEVNEFNSIADAKRFMGLPTNTLTSQLNPKRFGILLNGDFEFRFADDTRPWFYENRTMKVSGKYWFRMVKDGLILEAFNKGEFCRLFPEYKTLASDISFQSIVNRFRINNPGVEFTFRDASLEDRYGESRVYQRKNRFRVWLYDTIMKKEIIFENSALCGDFIGRNRKFVTSIMNTARLFEDRYLIANANDEEHISKLKELFKDRGVNKPL